MNINALNKHMTDQNNEGNIEIKWIENQILKYPFDRHLRALKASFDMTNESDQLMSAIYNHGNVEYGITTSFPTESNLSNDKIISLKDDHGIAPLEQNELPGESTFIQIKELKNSFQLDADTLSLFIPEVIQSVHPIFEVETPKTAQTFFNNLFGNNLHIELPSKADLEVKRTSEVKENKPSHPSEKNIIAESLKRWFQSYPDSESISLSPFTIWLNTIDQQNDLIDEVQVKIDESLKANKNLISEALADLLAKKGKNLEAIDMYERLILKYPEKSGLFAAKISQLRNSI